MFMRLINRLKSFEQQIVFLRWATGNDYGKITYVGDDYIEFSIFDIDSMEYKETAIINAQLIFEVIYGGSDLSRIRAEMSFQVESN